MQCMEKLALLCYSLSKLSWRDRKRVGKGIHLTENGSNNRHVTLMGMKFLVVLMVVNYEQWGSLASDLLSYW